MLNKNALLSVLGLLSTAAAPALADSPAPVTVVDRENLEQAGITNVADVLRTLPSVNLPSSDASTGFTGGETMKHRETEEFDGMRTHIEDDSLWERTTSEADREADEDDDDWDDEDWDDDDDDVEWDDEDDEPTRKGRGGWDGDDGW